jgi:hypothetical protein
MGFWVLDRRGKELTGSHLCVPIEPFELGILAGGMMRCLGNPARRLQSTCPQDRG